MDCKGICKEVGITFTWVFENFRYCKRETGVCISSPAFAKGRNDHFWWNLELYPKGFDIKSKDFISFYLYFLRSDTACNIDFHLSFIAVDGSVLVSKRLLVNDFKSGQRWGSKEFVKREEVFKISRKDYLPGDVLTASCRIWVLEETIARDGHWFVRSRIGIQRWSFLWNIEKFSSFQESRCSENESMMTLKFFPRHGENSETFIDVKVCAHDPILQFSTFRIYLLDSYGDRIECLNDEFTFTESIKSTFFTLTFSKEELKKENLYLQNDVLQLCCEYDIPLQLHPFILIEKICWGCSSIQEEGLKSKKMQDSTRTLKENLESSYKENLLCDMKLKTKTGSFPAHKFILSARSLVFRNMFSLDMKEKSTGCVDIDDLDDDTVQRMLLYIYTATMPDLQWNSACNLYAAADKYEILSLKSECSSFLKDNLSPDNALDLLILSDMHQDEHLKSSTEKFILNHRGIFKTNEWKLILKTNLQLAADLMCLALNK
ncbi:TD and POZ domain-containing protein 1 [Trichonephila clavipes]|nr:TD and POZ domain-containing protein 1 [Trichonephila clavipes]